MTRSPARHNSFEHGRIPLSTAKRTNIVKRYIRNKLEGNRSSRAIRFLRKRAAYKTLAIKMMNLLASRKFQFFVVLLISFEFLLDFFSFDMLVLQSNEPAGLLRTIR